MVIQRADLANNTFKPLIVRLIPLTELKYCLKCPWNEIALKQG